MKKALIAFLVMAVVGAGAVFIFAQRGSRDGFGGKGFGGRGFERIARKLNLSDDQKAQVKTILEESKTRVKPLMDAMRENRQQTENLGIEGTFDEEQVNRLATAQAETSKLLFIEREKTKAQIFAVLTPEQRTEAAKMKERFKERFRGGFKKRGGGEQPETGCTEE